MPSMSNKNNLMIIFLATCYLFMYFCNEWTSSIIDDSGDTIRLFSNSLRYAMCTINDHTPTWNLRNFINKYSPFIFKVLYNIFIMDYFVTNVDWRSMFFNGTLNNLDSAINSCTKTPRIC